MGYCSLPEVKDRVQKTDASDDGIIAQIIDGATKVIDRICNRPDGLVALTTAVARYYPGSGAGHQFIDECTAITQVAVKDSLTDTTYTTWASPTTDYAGDGDWLPARGDLQSPIFGETPFDMLLIDPNGDYSVFLSGKSGRIGLPSVKITAKWGYATIVPPQVREACAIQAARWYKRFQSSMADTLATTDLGELVYRQSLDPDVKAILMHGRLIKPAIGRR